MLSARDFEEKQILFVDIKKGVNTEIKFWNDNVRLFQDGKNQNQLSCHRVFVIFVVGDFSLTSYVIRNCIAYGISIFLLKNNFETYATIESSAEGNYLLRQEQYSNEREFEMAKAIVENKILNQYLLLKEAGALSKNEFKLLMKEKTEKIANARGEKELLGIEGSVTRSFFDGYFKDIGWYKRMPRVKIDPYNVLLDIGYTFLFNYIDSLLRLYGFDTYKGFYHKTFFQRKSLACDIMEPFRCIIDRQLLKSVNLKQINKDDFKYQNERYVLPWKNNRKYVKIFLDAIAKNKNEMFRYVKEYYQFSMNDDREFPVFKITR